MYEDRCCHVYLYKRNPNSCIEVHAIRYEMYLDSPLHVFYTNYFVLNKHKKESHLWEKWKYKDSQFRKSKKKIYSGNELVTITETSDPIQFNKARNAVRMLKPDIIKELSKHAFKPEKPFNECRFELSTLKIPVNYIYCVWLLNSVIKYLF